MQPIGKKQKIGPNADQLNSLIAHKLIRNYDHILGSVGNDLDAQDLFGQAQQDASQADLELTDTFEQQIAFGQTEFFGQQCAESHKALDSRQKDSSEVGTWHFGAYSDNESGLSNSDEKKMVRQPAILQSPE